MNAITEIGSKTLDLATIPLMIERLNREPETEISIRQTEVIPKTKSILYLSYASLWQLRPIIYYR